MTAIKQVSVTTTAHAKNLAKYLNDERAIARSSQHIINEDDWEKEMKRTREAYGHDKVSRAGAANTIMYHQVLAFNPDECDVNGGRITPAFAMKYARHYIERRYPNQEAVWVLHKEHCAADHTDRYAVHIGIGRTDLETGKRLNEGRSKYAKVERANTVRDMDRLFGLHQMKAGVRNSKVHARQPSRVEREMVHRGLKSKVRYIRNCIKHEMQALMRDPHQASLSELKRRLANRGVSMRASISRRDFTFEHDGVKINGVSLGRGYSGQTLTQVLEHGMEKDKGLGLENGMER